MSSVNRRRRKKKNKRKCDKSLPLCFFNNNSLSRYIFVWSNEFNDINDQLMKISDEVNRIVQNLSFKIIGRQIPFISLYSIKSAEKINEMDKVRVFLKGIDNEYWVYPEMKEKREDISHLLEVQITAEYRQITFSNLFCDAKLVLDYKFFYIAAVDLFLDLIMFHSYSFLRNMSIGERKRFSLLKYQFYIDNGLECYFDHDDEDELLYYSLAFSAHRKNGDLDIDKYLMLWDKFMQTYYKECIHIENSCEEQLEAHRNIKQIKKDAILTELDMKPAGDYLLLLTNRKVKDSKKRAQIEAIFGKRGEHLKAWKIVSIAEYPKYKVFIQQYYISAFKIVKA